jgi:hypothetical protein
MFYLKVILTANLKAPTYRWFMNNTDNDSGFSNTGSFRSLQKCLLHAQANSPKGSIGPDTKVIVETIHGYDSNDNAVKTTIESYFFKLLKH